MNYEQEIIDEISSKKDCSIDEAKKMIENLPLEYFFKKLTNTCLLYEIISKNKENLLAAF